LISIILNALFEAASPDYISEFSMSIMLSVKILAPSTRVLNLVSELLPASMLKRSCNYDPT